MKQYEAVIQTLEKLGGVATLGQLNQEVFKIKDCEWKSKTPFASIRRIVQENENIYKIKPGLWALKSYQKKLEDNSVCFLVDHTENAYTDNIIGIIDHHGTIPKQMPEYYINKNISSSAMIIYDINPDIFNKEDELLIVLASLVDTASFNSSKTKKLDIAKILEIVKKK